MADAILVLNAGSSSIKFALFPSDGAIPRQAAIAGLVDGIGASPRFTAHDGAGSSVVDRAMPELKGSDAHHRALEALLDWLSGNIGAARIAAVGHRVVHGGERFAEPVRLDPALIDALESFVPLAPLHQPHNVDAIRTIARLLPDMPQVACFDTAFHRSQPPLAQLFALPRALTAEGVRRYGFHGLSYEYIAEALPEHMGGAADGRVIVAHLGNGASMCAMHGRRSVASTMGFTPIEGLMMGTRTGSIDPGVLLYLMDYHGMDSKAISRVLCKESGLLGVSGISSDMRALLASDRIEAREAVDLFCYRIVREIGSLAAALGGLNALVFTGGIGEHAPVVREKVCRALPWLGVELDDAANASPGPRISTPDSHVAVFVLPTNEEWVIARHTARFVLTMRRGVGAV